MTIQSSIAFSKGKDPHAIRFTDNGLQVGPDYIRVMAVYITDQCNLSCVNCCSETVKTDSKESMTLSPEAFKAAIDVYMDPQQFPYKGKKVICIEGGETFLAYHTIIAGVEHAQKYPVPPHFYIHSNGTLVRPDWIKKLREYDCEILFSIDGDRGGNDRYRRFPYGSKKSVWDVIMKKLDRIPKEGLGVNMVLRPEALDGMISAMKTFTDMGFPFVNFAMDYYYLWNDKEIARLERFFDDFYDFFVAHTEDTGKVPFLCGAIHDALNREAALSLGQNWWQHCVHIILGSDGHFYACESIGMFNFSDVQDRYTLNKCDSDKGINWAKRNKWMDDADVMLGKNGRPDKEWQHMCPRLYAQVSEVEGTDPSDVVNMMHKTSRMLRNSMIKIATRLREHPDFMKKHVAADVVQGS